MSAKEIRYTIKRTDNCAEARLAKCYQEGTYGKGSFIGDCLSVGFIMKETGFTDLIKMLDSDPTFHSLTAMEKRERIISLIAGNRLPIHSEGAQPQAKEPAPAFAAPEEAKKKASLPKLGQ